MHVVLPTPGGPVISICLLFPTVHPKPNRASSFFHYRNYIIDKVKTKKNIIVVGPRLLISLDKSADRTDAGLYLPPTVKDKEDVLGGYIVKTGPGYPIHDSPLMSDEPWAASRKETRYVPLEAREGDYALFLKKEGVEIQFEGEKYLIVPHSAILALIRTDIVE